MSSSVNYVETPVDVVSSFRHRATYLISLSEEDQTKEGNSSDVIDLITLSNIDDTARDTGTADRITKDDTCSYTCMLASYVVCFCILYISLFF